MVFFIYVVVQKQRSEKRMKVNGEIISCTENMTVSELLARRGHIPERVAVEKNGNIIPRANFSTEKLCDADSIEIVQFVGGG